MAKLPNAPTIASITKAYGKEALKPFSEVDKDFDVIPTGVPRIDLLLGHGGFPSGSIVEISGPEASCKTTLGLMAMAQAQKKGLKVAFIDMEGTLWKNQSLVEGVGLDNTFEYNRPKSGEEALNITLKLAASGDIGLIVVDSVASLITQAEIDNDIGEATVGQLARLMANACKKLSPVVGVTGCTIIFINQLRANIGGYGNPETRPGGNSLKFYASVRIDIRRKTPIKLGDQLIGAMTKCTILKCKFASPMSNVEFPMLYGKGYDLFQDVIAMAEEKGIITHKGAWYYIDDEQVGQGHDSVVEALKANVERFKAISERVGVKVDD